MPAPSNADALAWLRRTADWPDGRLVIWGEEGCGKSHLLTVWAAEAEGRVSQAPALRGVPDPPNAARIAIDDADATGDEEALLHLLNAAQESRIPVLMAARSPPARWRLRLPDLASRVRASAAVRIGPPDEELLRALLSRLLTARQIAVAQSVQDWLLIRLPRTPAAIREAAARLDRAALAGHTAVTRGLAARILGDLDAGIPQNGAESLSGDPSADSCACPSAPVGSADDENLRARPVGGRRPPARARPPGGRAAAVGNCAGPSRTVHQPGALLARLQPSRGRGGGEPAASAAGARPLRVDQRLQPGRVLFRARRRADRAGEGGRGDALSRRPHAGPAARGNPGAGRVAAGRPAAGVARAARPAARRRDRGLRPDAAFGRRRRVARSLVHGAGVSRC